MTKQKFGFYLKAVFITMVIVFSCLAAGCTLIPSRKQDDSVTPVYENQIIDGVAYWYNESNERIMLNNEFVEYNGDNYYVIENNVVTGYYLIDETMYNFGEDGVQDTQAINDVFVTIDEDTYYVVNNTVVSGYIFADGSVYCFDAETKIMYCNQEVDGYIFDEYGKICNEDLQTLVFVTINENEYFICGNNAYICTALGGKIIISDADADIENNESLTDALVTVNFNGFIFTAYTDSEGEFVFDAIPATAENITVEKSGYVTIETDLSHLNESSGLIIADQSVSNTLKGKILIADADMNYGNNSALSNATISLERVSSTNAWLKTAVTDENGNYEFTELTAGLYLMTVSCEGYLTLNQTVYVHHNQANVQNMALEMIGVPDEGEVGGASGIIVDASTGKGVANLNVYVYEGVNATSGEVVYTTETLSDGSYSISDLRPGNYTLKVVDERELQDEDDRFGESVFSVKVLKNTTISNQNTTVSNASAINANSMRIVLTWGATPNDLDSHLSITGALSAHIYYNNKQGSSASLDVDDQSAYGPETITITNLAEGCVYNYYVHVFTSGATFANSNAMVRVYLGESTVPYYTFYVPEGSGIYWNIFSYDATTNTFTIIDQVSSSAIN